MQTSVSVWFGIGNIILDLQHRYIVLLFKHLHQRINIVGKRTDNARARYVENIFADILHRDRYTVFCKLCHNAARSFSVLF